MFCFVFVLPRDGQDLLLITKDVLLNLNEPEQWLGVGGGAGVVVMSTKQLLGHGIPSDLGKYGHIWKEV